MPDQTIPRNAYFVLVAGTLNPLLHHPQWYHSISAINEEELSESLKNGMAGTTPIASRMQFGLPSPLIITVQTNLWMIQTSDDGSWSRMLRIASLVFAKGTGQSSIAYGLMAQRHIDTDANAKSILAERIKHLNLGLPIGDNASSVLQVADSREKLTVTSSVQSSVFGDKTVFGLYHCDYPAQEIADTDDPRFQAFAIESERFFSDVVATINGRTGKG